jgi:hypothetical protein
MHGLSSHEYRSDTHPVDRVAELEARVKELESALEHALIWDQARRYIMPYHVRDPIREVLAKKEFSPSEHGAHVGDVFNKQRIENLERELAQAKSVIAEQKSQLEFERGICTDYIEQRNEQAALIETLADALSTWNKRNKEQQGYIPQWAFKAMRCYEEWKK